VRIKPSDQSYKNSFVRLFNSFLFHLHFTLPEFRDIPSPSAHFPYKYTNPAVQLQLHILYYNNSNLASLQLPASLTMSGPYDQYGNQQYGGSPAPSGGYGAPAHYDPNYPQQHQQGGHYPPQQQYGQVAPYDQSQQQYGQYGPPATGGFQHGQTPYQDPNAPQGYGAAPQAPTYHDPNAQSQYGGAPAYGQQDTRQQYPGSAPSNQYPQQGPYSQAPYDANNPQANYQAGGAPGGAQEGDRGLMGALAGGAAGAFGGHKMGHGILGGLAGAFLGSKLEDKAKDHNKKPNQGYGGY
jgi:hypothetical protein